ncbi:serine protease (zymogen-like), putative [Theileria annulata]|uniref:Serine protease (Zymogen-like), putative n=1 Tax=Theileria annulata TaxID=5874 RepID=Q4UGQ4_THEAN|nr:serine protease (zymogen-like), putative [Theileria annulata]CAI73735.1 serine protease (zymogen-like), putative [Theileria annulata]|eukprot:XP_954412.1 serine protease (zymogen-like), putative [Theileria annulata]
MNVANSNLNPSPKLIKYSINHRSGFIQRKFNSSIAFSNFFQYSKFSGNNSLVKRVPFLNCFKRFDHTKTDEGVTGFPYLPNRIEELTHEQTLEGENIVLNPVVSPCAPYFTDSYSSIIKLYCDSTDPNYSQPWQMRKQIKSIGSAFVIKDKLILTNAHCVSWQNRCLVKKHGSTMKYPARLIEIGHECDLAVLTVDDDSFWEGIEPFEFGDVPNLHDNVTVVGYPTGGDNLCITSGVVSRVDVTTYCHSNFRLLCVQIDAAINSGNSGGPAIKDGKVIGVAFQAYDEAQNIGYIIPTCIISQFLKQIELFKKYTGFVTIGITYQLLTNPYLKSYLSLNNLPQNVNPSGILVCQYDKSLNGIIQTNDVILQINGHDVADDGTVHFRGVERVHLAYSLKDKFCGDECELLILRDNNLKKIKIRLGKPNYLVPEHQWDIMPRYYIYGGLVFIPLSMEYLKDEFGKKFYERAPNALLKPLSDIFAKEKGEEVVVLSQILASDLTIGYDFKNIRLVSVNDVKVLNLKHLEQMLMEVTKDSKYVKFQFEQDILVVLETSKVPEFEHQILEQHAISSHKSRII